MAATTDRTTPTDYLFTPRGTPCPKLVTQDWLNAEPDIHPILAEIALATNAAIPFSSTAYRTLIAVVDAIRDGVSLAVVYRNEAGAVTDRILAPTHVTFTHRARIVFKAHCSVRGATRTFVLDGVLNCQPVPPVTQAA